MSRKKKVVISSPVTLAVTRTNAFLGVLWDFFSPPCLYLTNPRKNGAVAGNIFQSLLILLHYFIQNSTATVSEKQKLMWYSIAHTCFVFRQENGHNRSKHLSHFDYHQAHQLPCQAMEFRLRSNSP